jgi:hypothetical protein
VQANPRTIDALFNSQLRYVVPMFQRLYVWEEHPQWATLWEDVAEKADLQLTGAKTNPHYLGALIIEGVRPSSPREVKRFLVIDGQQRMTTLQLLLCSFRDLSRKNDWRTLDRAMTRYLENSDADVMEKPEEEVYKLWPTTLNRDVFRAIISAGSSAEVERAFPLVWLPKKRKPEPRSNLVEGYLYFARNVQAWVAQTATKTGKPPEDCAFALLQALQQDFCVVEIALSDGDDSQEIFYSLNSQGRPLSQSDLLRSLIFMRAEKENQDRDQIFRDYWSKFETTFWSAEIKRAGRTYSRLDLGLRYFLMAKTGQLIDARRVNEEYRRWIGENPKRYPSVREELADLARHGAAYERYEGALASSLPSTDLRRVIIDLDVSTVTPLLLYLELEAGLDMAQVIECLSLVESFIARRAFMKEENKEYNKLFVEVIGSLKAVKPADVKSTLVQKLLSGGGSTRRWPTDAELVEHVISKAVFELQRSAVLRLILERLELALRGKKTEEHAVPAGLQIEHVLPQAWGANWPLNGATIPASLAKSPFLARDEQKDLAEPIRQRNAQLQSLGNLTLLNKHLNPAASNGSFDAKQIEYKHSVLRLNRYFDGLTKWDEHAITERGRKLGELLCKVWPRPGATN